MELSPADHALTGKPAIDAPQTMREMQRNNFAFNLILRLSPTNLR
jgi:hypothetical protein